MEKIIKIALIFLGLLSLFGALAKAQMPHCASSKIYQDPATLRQINWMEGAKPTCKNDFITQVEKEQDRDPSCKTLLKKMASIAQKNVFKLKCDHAQLNATFLSPKVFITNNHAFTTAKNYYRLPDSLLSTCKIIHFDPALKMNTEEKINLRSLRLGDRTRDGDVPGDFAVVALDTAINDVEPVDFISSHNVQPGQEFFVASAFSGRRSETRSCFSLTKCLNYGPTYKANQGGGSSVYVTNCPEENGTSGSAVFTLLKDEDGKCKSIALVGLQEGGTTNSSDGSPFYFPPSGDVDDQKAMWSYQIAIDNKFRDYVSEITRAYEGRDYSETKLPKIPAGEDL